MFTQQDIEFHAPATSDPLWAETNYFGFYIPEERIKGGIHVTFRPNLGMVNSSVHVFQGYARNHFEAAYADYRSNLPMPKSGLADYSLANGLRVQAPSLMAYKIDYSGYGNTEIHITFEGLMPPYDIHDPEMDPIAARQKGKEFSLGGIYSNHFDQTGHVKGELRLKGKTYRVDCVAIMDHSWGIRPETQCPRMCWFQANFSRDLAFHCMFGFEPYENDLLTPLQHGYVMEAGKVYGLRDGKGISRRDGFQQTSVKVEVEDVRGKHFQLTGSAIATYPWNAYPNFCVFTSLNEWNLDGRIGYGESQDVLTIPYIIGERPR